ncbi:MAG: hypothetical protein JWM33_483 [Caulobacteraceae bacterium]|nr:hypothetical protein [Caulobacteraceae bacterium]
MTTIYSCDATAPPITYRIWPREVAQAQPPVSAMTVAEGTDVERGGLSSGVPRLAHNRSLNQARTFSTSSKRHLLPFAWSWSGSAKDVKGTRRHFGSLTPSAGLQGDGRLIQLRPASARRSPP